MKHWYQLTAITILAVCGCSGKNLPSYYRDYLKETAALIRDVQKNEADGFYFWTDAHYPDNAGNAVNIFRFLQKHSSPRVIFFGGDASENSAELDESLSDFLQDIHRIKEFSDIILLRGNHDFVNYTGDFKTEWGKKKALPQEEVASIIRSASKGSVVRDSCDRHSCYGYFDRNGIRYILIDTSDHVADSTVVYGMSDNQIDWILSEAVLKAPQGSGIVLLSHIPLACQLFQDFVPSHVEMRRCLLGAVRAEAVEFAGKIYDFADRKDLHFLMVLSGHRHRDSGDNSDGILQILTGNDSLTPNPRIESPAVGERGTVLEHCIDYVSVSEDFSTVSIIRIGRGQNRIFDVKK